MASDKVIVHHRHCLQYILITELNNLKLGININENNICCLLYADELVIFAETEHNLHLLLNALDMWCLKWKMKIKESYSKIVHFRRKGTERSICNFKVGTCVLGYESCYKYLGVWFDEHLLFNACEQSLS